MVKNSFSGVALAAALLSMPTLGAPGNLEQNLPSFPAVVAPVAPLVKRDPLIELSDRWPGAYFYRYPNEGARKIIQGYTPIDGKRFTIVNEAGETMWVWIEATVYHEDIVKITEPNAPWAEKIKIGPGESVQFGSLPIHSGTVRAYARCTESGENCAGDLGAATKWEWTINPAGHIGNIGINLSLGTSGSDFLRGARLTVMQWTATALVVK